MTGSVIPTDQQGQMKKKKHILTFTRTQFLIRTVEHLEQASREDYRDINS